MYTFDANVNPLLDDSPATWERLIDAVSPAALLVVIEKRMSANLRRLHSPEDVLQEALMHAWRDRRQCEWRGLKSFRSWLLTIIDNRIGHLAAAAATQKRGAAAAVPFSALAANGASNGEGTTAFAWPAGSTTPSRVAIFREQANAIRAALNALPDDLREVVQLRLFEQHTLEQIAQRLGTGISAVGRRFAKGVELYESALRNALATTSAGSKARRAESAEKHT